MIVTLNGQKKKIAKPLNVQQLLQHEGYGDMLVAVAKNGTFVPKNSYSKTEIEDGDELEIVAPMQGG